MERLVKDSLKTSKRPMSVNQTLNSFLKTSKNYHSYNEVYNTKIDRAINQYLIEILKNKNFDLKSYCNDQGIPLSKFKKRYEETRKEPLRVIHFNDKSSSNLNNHHKIYNAAKTAVAMGTATKEQQEIYEKKKESIKKSQMTRLVKKHGAKEGKKKYNEWLINSFDTLSIDDSTRSIKSKRDLKGGNIYQNDDDNLDAFDDSGDEINNPLINRMQKATRASND